VQLSLLHFLRHAKLVSQRAAAIRTHTVAVDLELVRRIQMQALETFGSLIRLTAQVREHQLFMLQSWLHRLQ